MKKVNLVRYSVWLFAIRLAFPLVAVLVTIASGLELGSSGISVIAPMLAAMVVGHRYGQQYGELIPTPEVNRFARIALVIAVLAEIVTSLVWGYILLGAEFTQFVASIAHADGKALMVVVFLIVTVLTYFANRWGVTMGAKSALKSKFKNTSLRQ